MVLSARLFLSLLIFAQAGFLGAAEDSCALWMAGKPMGAACLQELEQRDLTFLSDQPSKTDIQPSQPEVSPRFFRGVEAGNEEAVEIGFRLIPLLKGGTEQDVLRALGDAMVDHPGVFLEALQTFLDFSRKHGQAAALKETLWDAFVGADFGYAQDLEGESKDLKRRKAMLLRSEDPVFREAQGFTLGILREKIRELPDGL